MPRFTILERASSEQLWDRSETAYDAWCLATRLAGLLPFGSSRAAPLADQAKGLEKELDAASRAQREPTPPPDPAPLPVPAAERPDGKMRDDEVAALFADLGEAPTGAGKEPR